jgi:hypothetical protein
MDPLWSPAVANAGKGSRLTDRRNRLRWPKLFAIVCHPSPWSRHGKEGVDGSSPSEGSAKAPHVGPFSFRPTCSSSNVRWVWSRLWSFQAREPTLRAPNQEVSWEEVIATRRWLATSSGGRSQSSCSWRRPRSSPSSRLPPRGATALFDCADALLAAPK